MPNVGLQILLVAVPYLALAVVGVILFIRERTIATALVALGFGALTVSHVFVELVSFDYSHFSEARGAVVDPVPEFPGWFYTMTYWLNTFSPWVAATGLLWHTLRKVPASPNNRWRGP